MKITRAVCANPLKLPFKMLVSHKENIYSKRLFLFPDGYNDNIDVINVHLFKHKYAIRHCIVAANKYTNRYLI